MSPIIRMYIKPCHTISPLTAAFHLRVPTKPNNGAAHSATTRRRLHISLARHDVEKKLVDGHRGGYCFEQNTLLQMALEALGFGVVPLLCRVRWNKPDDTAGANTQFTHLALKATTHDGEEFLADVGFAGTNSIAPVALASSEPQTLPEGDFRIAAGGLHGVEGAHAGYSTLQLLVKGAWRPLYTWRNEAVRLRLHTFLRFPPAIPPSVPPQTPNVLARPPS